MRPGYRVRGRWMRWLTSGAGSLLALGLISAPASPAGESGTDAPAVPALPEELPEPRQPVWGERLDDRADWARLPLGAGHLAVAGPPPDLGAAWVEDMLLPLYEEPGGSSSGWLAHGWRIPPAGLGEPLALTTGAMVETGYAAASFVVLEIRDDGWFLLSYAPPSAVDAGSAWAHRDHLDLGAEPLVVETWEDRFSQVSPLYFRDLWPPHALRAGLSVAAKRRVRIGADHDLELLEVRGDWMRVRVHQPSKYCLSPADWHGATHEGWIRWRDPDKGPWVWYYTRGC